jgi:hypothetical protein
MIGAPLADILMNAFRSPTSVGAWQTLVAMAALYSVFMLAGASDTGCRRSAGDPRAGARQTTPPPR